MTLSIHELPPFTPWLEGFRLDEFHQQTLHLLAFAVEHDQRVLDLAPFQIVPPAPPSDPPLPLLPYVWYPKPTRAVRDWAIGHLTPPRSEPLIGKMRPSEAQRAMRPLLSGNGPVEIRGECGIGKTTLLTHIAGHERTRQRYRRIWWLDDPAFITQSLALALNSVQVLSETDFGRQLELLHPVLDDGTLLVIDNLSLEQAAALRGLTKHLLLGIETPAEAATEEEPNLTEPEDIITLRRLPRNEAAELMLHLCNLTDRNTLRGQMRAWVSHITRLLDGHPLAITLAASLFHEDGLPMERVVELFNERTSLENPNPYVALDISLGALPTDYEELLQAFGALSPIGANFEAIVAAAGLKNDVAGYRGLAFLMKRGLVSRDTRIGSTYSAHRLVWERVVKQAASNKKLEDRLRQWVLSIARRYREDTGYLYQMQRELLYTLDQGRQQKLNSFTHKLDMSLGAYLREYAPTYLEADAPAPPLLGERARAATLIGDGLRLLEHEQLPEAFAAFQSGIEHTKTHGSEHELAEGLMAFARYYVAIEDYTTATDLLEQAARLVFDLKADASLHIIRIGLAMLYRKQERYKDALGVLDDDPDTLSERARIYQAMKNWDAMIEALEAAPDVSPYDKAQGYLQARRYADALDAIASAKDNKSAFLRAVIYHLQNDLENALRGYEMALDTVSKQSPQRLAMLLAMGKVYVTQNQLDRAEKTFQQALDLTPTLTKPDPLLQGQTLGLIAALHLLEDTPTTAVELAQKALEALKKVEGGYAEKADIYRTLGRAYLRLGVDKHKAAILSAFEGEAHAAQSLLTRDEARIGIALHHLGNAYRLNGQNERAIANYRRALTHKNAQDDPLGYLMTQIALHQTLFEDKRYEQALATIQETIQHLKARPPSDLQRLGYLLCSQARTEQELNRLDQAIKTLGQWQNTLAGRPDALHDPRPSVVLLTLNLAVRSMLAHQRPAEAKPLADMAVNLADIHYPATPIAWSSRRDLGQVYLSLQDWESTVNSLAPLLYEAVEAEPFTFALAHSYTGIAHAQLGNRSTALSHLDIAYKHHPIEHEKALLQERIAMIYLEMGNTEAAIEHTHTAVPLANRQVAPGDAARLLTNLARLLSGTNRYADSIEVYEDALAMLRALPDADAVHTARVYISLADSHEAQGQYPQAAIAYRNALDTLEATRKAPPDDHRQALTRLAGVQAIMRNYDDAVATYLQARQETELYGSQTELGLVLTALADIYRAIGRLEDAVLTYEEALKALPAMSAPRERAATLRGYGQTLSALGHLAEARQAWTEALAITTDAPALEIALTHRAIAQAYHTQAMYTEAEKAFQEALDFHQAGKPETAETWRLYGKTLIGAGRHTDSIKPLQQALDIEKSQPQQVNGRIVESLDLLAAAQESVGVIAAAIACHHEALVYTDRNFQPIETANRYRTLGRLYSMQARWQEAHTALEEALGIEFNHKPRSDSRIAQTLEMIAQAYKREGNLIKASEAYKRMASYANLSKTAAAELKATQDELQRHEATLEAAQASLDVLLRTNGSDLKDIIYVYALLARSYAGVSRFDASNDAIDQLLSTLETNAIQLSTIDERAHYRALAHVFEGSQAASEGNLVEARAHFQRALHETTDQSMRWVIERGLESVQE